MQEQPTPDDSAGSLANAAMSASSSYVDNLIQVSVPEPIETSMLSESEHYKLVIEDARALGDRRETINNLFVSIVSLIAGGQAYILVVLPGSNVGLAVTIVAALFGLRLCKVWDNVLGNYKALLDFRYHTLKLWEKQYNFPSLRRYYISEDILYGPLKPGTALSDSVPPEWVGRASAFVSMYVALPKTARLIFYTLTIAQGIAVTLQFIGPLLSKTLTHWHIVFPFNGF